MGEYDGRQFLVMELLEGGTLKQYMDVRALPVEQVLELGMQIAAALQTAHGKLGWERQQKRKDLRDQNPSRRAVRARTIPGAFPAIRKLSRLLGASTFRVRLRLSLFSHADRPSAS